MSAQTFFLKTKAPIRAYAIAALLSLIGGALLFLSVQQAWHTVVVVAAAIILGLGIALLLVALIATWRFGLRITLTDKGYSVAGTHQTHTGSWLDVSKILQAVEGTQLTIYHGTVVRTHIIFPGGTTEAQVEEVVNAILDRIDAAKSATPLSPQD